MSNIKILVVEDELIIAEDIKNMLTEMGHQVIGIASDITEAKEILMQDEPDIALLDIHLRGSDDGITLAEFIRRKLDIPIIFITSYSDKMTVERAKQVMPEGYIVKPFEKADLFTSIEIALFNYEKKNNHDAVKDESLNVVIRDSIFIRKDYMLIKIRFGDLIWIKSELNYLELHCRDNRHLVRSTLKEFIDKLPAKAFIQVHKSYCINTSFITAIDRNTIWLGELQIPFGRAYFEIVKNFLNIDI